MMDLGKKMGDKLEEKRRRAKEKGRHIIEKMCENARANSMEKTTGIGVVLAGVLPWSCWLVTYFLSILAEVCFDSSTLHCAIIIKMNHQSRRV
ncbi:hypothetical protein ZWY2020_047265 [Hordeum vulgare]|nr:hypothetical protein ZWY2020_047265 [Hordeum vulgare]